jgi:hypothetical protein
MAIFTEDGNAVFRGGGGINRKTRRKDAKREAKKQRASGIGRRLATIENLKA